MDKRRTRSRKQQQGEFQRKKEMLAKGLIDGGGMGGEESRESVHVSLLCC